MTTLSVSPGEALAQMRAARPLVHNITNYVVMGWTANVLLAAGAAPAMIHAEEEAGEFAAIASALVINIGTISQPWLNGMLAATSAANAVGKPWILDPVGGGATAFRREAVATLLLERPAVVRGNASEILAAAGSAATGRGVDAADEADAAVEACGRLAVRSGAAVVASGAVDVVSDGTRLVRIANGTPMLAGVTGTGCAATALIGAFLGAGLPAFEAATAGMVLLGVAGEIAADGASGPGSFAVRLLDTLAAVTPADLEARARVS
ncbi:hydroxyethylthiazole kinase [Pseudoxanthobacter sp. M-2]|uniref:hydroxyethylthiazole kinase n=1 Tax=Pseudoxanthobacter sp. M-2 TaxID=3078754 RepID=UPI0038FBEF58